MIYMKTAESDRANNLKRYDYPDRIRQLSITNVIFNFRE